jgi:D-beta-D-heptose 7-phosphate kinase/D-beta-D-heptose 1-phosphate adenosyltransferase
MSKIVLVTGGFDPIHTGHISYLSEAKKLGDILIVGVNSDSWLTRKKGKPFLSSDERAGIIQALRIVDVVVQFADDYDSDNSAIKFIEDTLENYPEHEIVFANGGDRTDDNIPEMIIDNPRLRFVSGIGGTDKKNSSSWILDEWKTQKTERPWGYWRVLDDKPQKGYKVKELVIMPGKSLSDQRHFKRSEDWRVLEGIVKMETEFAGIKDTVHLTQKSFTYCIGKEVWHHASNPGTEPAHILEVQWGECHEADIERRQ